VMGAITGTCKKKNNDNRLVHLPIRYVKKDKSSLSLNRGHRGRLLFPGVGIDGGKALFLALDFVDAGRIKVGVVDKYLPLAGVAKLAEPPLSLAGGDTWGAGPCQV